MKIRQEDRAATPFFYGLGAMSTESTATRSWVALLAAAGASTAWFFWRRWRDRRLPPGNVWMLPLLGESLSYVQNPLGFIEDWSSGAGWTGGKLVATYGTLQI